MIQKISLIYVNKDFLKFIDYFLVPTRHQKHVTCFFNKHNTYKYIQSQILVNVFRYLVKKKAKTLEKSALKLNIFELILKISHAYKKTCISVKKVFKI